MKLSILLKDILVNEDFRELLQKVKDNLPDLKVKTGGDGIPKKPKARVHPMVSREVIKCNPVSELV